MAQPVRFHPRYGLTWQGRQVIALVAVGVALFLGSPD
jgi:hypothetical protein